MKGLHQLIRDVENIAKSNLDIFSCVRGNTEFEITTYIIIWKG